MSVYSAKLEGLVELMEEVGIKFEKLADGKIVVLPESETK
jgi:hypothetical protein